MGAWDATIFGNDTAADWAGDLAEEGSASDVVEVLTAVAGVPDSDHLDADIATEALAAAEVVAAALGVPTASNAYNEGALAWATAHREVAAYRALAIAAAERVGRGESELPELWDEGGARAEWDQSVADLLARLQSTPAGTAEA